ncbi:chloride channel protein [Streptococcus himalayensis]|uniref:Voltage-gated chloride channel protein n=1 Tax=Streptococcus himalayensis TaxID=1888195 RepID=A0A917A9Q8_9STRE|nr:chloride channel protein [Streptococcus himalayensis]GGE37692.1 voltage-gated chloride channel protein [Streptococcus himalayensis]
MTRLIKAKEFILWSLFALVIGFLAGILATCFGQILLWVGEIRSNYIFVLLPFLPLIGLVIVWLYQRYGGRASQGMSLVFKVGQGEKEEIPRRLIPLVIVTTWFTHLFGGSAGREGVAVQLGATLSYQLGKRFFSLQEQRRLIVIGMAAGFAGLFQTPLAATLFAMEVLVVGSLALSAMWPALIAAFVASQTAHFLGLEKFSHALMDAPVWTSDLFGTLLILGFLFGLCGNAFAWCLSQTKALLNQYFPNPYRRVLILGTVLSVLLLVGQGRYAGLGTNLIAASFSGQAIASYDWIFKLLLTVLTLAVGYQGGEVTPLFAIGSSLGVVLAPFFGLPLEFVAALGYASVFAAATSTFLGPILIGCEVFGFEHFPAFFLVCSLAFLLNRANSIYSGQKIRE